MNALIPSFRRAPVLSSLPTDIKTEMERVCEEKNYSRRQVIYEADHKNDIVYFLVAGRVKLVRTSPTSRELIVALAGPNDMFGETGMFDGPGAYGETAEALEETTVLELDRKQLATALSDNCPALREYAVLQERRRATVESRLAEHVFFDVPRRIARLLERLALDNARISKGGALIRTKLTHQDIANLVGSTRETTTLVLNDFRRRGLIDLSGRRIIVCDLDELAKFT